MAGTAEAGMATETSIDMERLAKSWWALAIRGVAAIIFGVLTLLLPGVTLAVLILLFGSYAIVEGAVNVIAAVRGRGEERAWWALLLAGLVSITAGVVTFLRPGLTELALLYVIAAWAVVTGVLEIAAAIRLRRRIRSEAWLGLNGILSIVFGVLTMLIPGGGALTIVWLIGAYAILFGGLLLRLSFRLRGRRAGQVWPPRRRRRPRRGAGAQNTVTASTLPPPRSNPHRRSKCPRGPGTSPRRSGGWWRADRSRSRTFPRPLGTSCCCGAGSCCCRRPSIVPPARRA
jgi:uncharacterized membrane protein HdeD (DUF308 family)